MTPYPIINFFLVIASIYLAWELVLNIYVFLFGYEDENGPTD
jgi:hypothetical protein